MESLIEQCTSEKKSEDDWNLILQICEEYGSKESKQCLKLVSKRVFHKNQNVSLRAIALLDACSKNCGKPFNREVASRDFSQLIKGKFSSLAKLPAVRLTDVFEKWAEKMKNDSELALAANLYTWVKTEHPETIKNLNLDRQMANAGKNRQVKQILRSQEDEELAKAIAMSLKDVGSSGGHSKEKSKKGTGSQSAKTGTSASSLYPSMTTSTAAAVTDSSTVSKLPSTSAKGKVRALYDFEAAEDNELTFKADELIVLLDDSDENWWRGSNHRGEGLFPAQFVKVEDGDESAGTKPVAAKENKKSFEEQVITPIRLDEAKLDECLRLISTVDPSGEFRADPPELARLEAECNAMAPLVDPELEKVDTRGMELSDLSQRLLGAFQTYHELMSKPSIPTSYYGGVPGMGAYGGGSSYPAMVPPGMPYGMMPNQPMMQQQRPSHPMAAHEPAPAGAYPEGLYAVNQLGQSAPYSHVLPTASTMPTPSGPSTQHMGTFYPPSGPTQNADPTKAATIIQSYPPNDAYTTGTYQMKQQADENQPTQASQVPVYTNMQWHPPHHLIQQQQPQQQQPQMIHNYYYTPNPDELYPNSGHHNAVSAAAPPPPSFNPIG